MDLALNSIQAASKLAGILEVTGWALLAGLGVAELVQLFSSRHNVRRGAEIGGWRALSCM